MSADYTQSFWHQIRNEHPIIGLSPMDGVTDQPYRHIFKKYGNPDLIYTEFTSVEGVCRGATQLLEDFLYDKSQHPIIGQIYGTTPDFFRQTSIILCQLGFDGIDINMGCPAKNVAHSGAGAALIQTPKLAQEIVLAAKQGVTEWKNGATIDDCPDITSKVSAEVKKRISALETDPDRDTIIPVSVKTRVGFSHSVVEEWIPALLETEPVAIGLHGRTLKQQYSGLASWEEIGKAAQITAKTDSLILGNGDIDSLETAHERITSLNLDGVLIGRASFGNPFVFNPQEAENHSIFEIALEHARLFEETYSSREKYSFLPMRKHMGWYIKGFTGAKEIRVKLFQANSVQDVEDTFREHKLIT